MSLPLFVQNAWSPSSGESVNLLVQDGIVQAVGPNVNPPAGPSNILQAKGMALVPPFVNGHTHAAMTLFRGYGDDMPLMEWLQTRIWPAEARLSEEDVYWGTRLACLEMIRSGTACFADMYWHYHAVARAVEDAGIRAFVGSILIDVAGEEQARQFQYLAEKNLEENSRYSTRVQFSLSPHAIYTVSGPSLSWLADFSQKHQVLTHIHLSETRHEVEECLRQHGMRPAFYLDQKGLLSPLTLLAHGVHLNEDELDLIASRGATLVTNPVSNMKLAVGGVFPYARAHHRRIPMAMGTDGAASNNGLDLLQDVKILALLQKHADGDPTVLPASQAFEILTGSRAPLLGLSGQIAAGEKADFLLMRRHDVEITPEHCFTSNLIYAMTGHQVDTMVVDGHILMTDRQIPDQDEIRHEVSHRAERVCKE
ncbi:MAG: amidohydrolase [Magnetococcales bacterium]|nr:amidohydrolase [Magnetococcales bacterium]NGZ28493.1 amidohydrolase [Magnetococcales bacterium]